HLATGQVNLKVQTVKSTWFRRPKIKLTLPDGRTVDSSNSNGSAAPISFIPHPLPRQAYNSLLHKTDCGLLLYDAETYFSRRAGILDELQVLGRPVIVSAGSWLADQLGSGQYQYTQQLANDPDRTRPLNMSEMSFSTANLPCEGGVLSFDEGRHPLEVQFETEPDENAIALQFQWRSPLVPGTYIRIEIAMATAVSCDRPTGTLPIAQCQIIGHAAKGLVPGVILRLPNGPSECRQFVVRVTNAFHDTTVCIQNLRVTAMKQFCGPLGYTGLAVADQSQLGGAIAEIVEHYAHYRQAAEASATQWQQEHDPHRVVDWLVATRQSSRRAA
ncbi:MAG TPA: hypothetical protein PKD54_06565, partial [Pirellulaceae bacterium]|nr:hypothetical protein [Pirellulaceae bacterium]